MTNLGEVPTASLKAELARRAAERAAQLRAAKRPPKPPQPPPPALLVDTDGLRLYSDGAAEWQGRRERLGPRASAALRAIVEARGRPLGVRALRRASGPGLRSAIYSRVGTIRTLLPGVPVVTTPKRGWAWRPAGTELAVPGLAMSWPDYLACEARLDGHRIALNPQEAELLLILLLRRGRWTSVPLLVEMMWPDADAQPETAERIVRLCVMALRAKLGADAIATSYGRGHMIPLPDAEPLAAAA